MPETLKVQVAAWKADLAEQAKQVVDRTLSTVNRFLDLAESIREGKPVLPESRSFPHPPTP